MIHESAYVENTDIGIGTNIWHFVHIRKGAKIGRKCTIGKGVYIDTDVVVGDRCKIQNFATIYQGVVIEDEVFIGPHVCFTNDVYPRACIWNAERLVKTLVKKGASIGANATIIAGVTIGRFAMVGAGSIVTTSVPDYGLVFGSPARLQGFVCECGFRLTERERADEMVVFACVQCGKTCEISHSECERVEA